MNRLTMFHQSYLDSVAQIEQFRTDPDMASITNWILTTKANLFSALPKGWGNLNSAQECETLLHVIHHALVDDGEISFPVVRGEPRMAFLSRWEDNFRNLVLTDAEKEFSQRFGTSIEITFLDTIDQFIEARDVWEANQHKRHFVADAARFGVDFAREHYPDVTDEQVQEWQADINFRVAQQLEHGM